MKHIKRIFAGMAAMFFISLAFADVPSRVQGGAADQNQWNFQHDADGDGIPNCIDDDWVQPQDGTGYQNRFGKNAGKGNRGANGFSNNWFHNYNWGGNNGTGVCDGTGPRGNRRGNRK